MEPPEKRYRNSVSNEAIYLDEVTADVSFIFRLVDCQKVERVPAHKAVLAAKSDVFRPMFFGDLKQTEVEIVDASCSAFKEFLQFFYLETVKLTLENIVDVIDLTNKYQMPESLDVCEKFLIDNLNLDEVISAIEISLKYKRKELLKSCIKMYLNIVVVSVKNRNIKDESEVRASLLKRSSKDLLKSILCTMPKVGAPPIYDFSLCYQWAKQACYRHGLDASDGKNQKEMLGECAKLIRFKSMRPNEVKKIVEQCSQWFDHADLVDIIQHFL